jgi:hypothetical protein
VREQLEALVSPDLEDREVVRRWERVKKQAPEFWERSGVQRILESVVSAAVKSELGSRRTALHAERAGRTLQHSPHVAQGHCSRVADVGVTPQIAAGHRHVTHAALLVDGLEVDA